MNFPSDMNIGGLMVLNEGNHNSQGNPHEQYINFKTSKEIPYTQGKYNRIAQLNINSVYNQFLYKLAIFKTDHSTDMEFIDVVLSIRTGATLNSSVVELIPSYSYGKIADKLKITTSVDNNTLVCKLWLLNDNGKKYRLTPLLITKQYDSTKFTYDLEPNSESAFNLGGTITSATNVINYGSVIPSRDNAYTLGNAESVYSKTYTKEIVLKSSANELWRVGVNADGTLWTTKA